MRLVRPTAADAVRRVESAESGVEAPGHLRQDAEQAVTALSLEQDAKRTTAWQ